MNDSVLKRSGFQREEKLSARFNELAIYGKRIIDKDVRF
jgi:hypothetical protein